MAIASANAAVQQLLLSHMGLGPKFNYRSLVAAPEFAALKYKQTLLTHACVTRSSPVVMDVLLFLSHTMSEALFHAELCLPKHLFALDHWANHLRQQQRSHQSTVFVSLRDYPLIALFKSVGRTSELAAEVTRLVLAEPDAQRARAWVDEAKALFSNTVSTSWLEAQLRQHISFQQLLHQTEARDQRTAPAAMAKAGYCDKRSSKGAAGLNWHKRFLVLDGHRFCYFKHDYDKMEKSTNPFLDKKPRGELVLDQSVSVRPAVHDSSTRAKQLQRPYCVEVLIRGVPIILFDAWTKMNQAEWLTAFEANIQRTSFDPIWLRFPRPCVLTMTLAQFLRYTMLYPDDSSTTDDQNGYVWDAHRVRSLQAAFNIDANRILYAALVHCAVLHEWDALEALTRPGKVKRLFTSQPQSTIGFGAFLDAAIEYKAPPPVLASYKAAYAKQTTGWVSQLTVA
ncbi:hypothetical protein SPRG_10909 [Saprolegnia parasitica CBS 223.65]|uniref:PH domain-containing protein n=1 Tax=Saprolegnia parasitica (strain CBS 223.65) TaxID=695850 RepID=A0A067CC61_SAPPC|nr:hypothetical protein SPRG_10909 [Saprolegnia parasitica CBS 223.65]KDO24121.1 hypothetical protein SPRG_10909 [Saprolegnia parasitica CBS 223.65]|eukprot:XP_012205256.1 hypothetical protein SPRG_10909 [Saprolegnia parasitica CBS 223.65]